MIRARRPPPGQVGVLLPGQEIQHGVGVGEVPDLRPVRRHQATDHRCERGRPRPPLGLGQRRVAVDDRAERVRPAAGGQEVFGGADHPQRILFALAGGGAPGGDPVPAQHAADRVRVRGLDRGDVQTQLEPRAPPPHPHHPVAETLLRQRRTIGRRRQRDPRIRVQMIHMRRVHQTVHRGVDRRCGAALAVQAVVERGDHVVLPLHPRVHVHQRAQPIQPQYRQPRPGQGAEVTTGPLHPQQLHLTTGHRIHPGTLRRRVPTRIIRVPRIRPQPVTPPDQLGDDSVAHRCLSVSASRAVRPGRRRGSTWTGT